VDKEDAAMRKRERRGRRRRGWRDERGPAYEIATALWDQPRTLPEIVDHFLSYVRWLGLFTVSERLERDGRKEHMAQGVSQELDDLIAAGWVNQQGDYYALTTTGREHAGKALSEVRSTLGFVRSLATPQTVSKVSLGVHLALAAIKLPAGLLSGSIGLINDATDTLLDGLSSLLVYAGLRLGWERAVNVVLVVIMLATGGFTFFEAAQRVFVPQQPNADWFAFAATIVSAVVCGLLYAYQRYVGFRSGSIALITQSVDSRNHVIVAASVTAALIAALLHFPLLDTLVGLAVAVLILKSAIELAVETVRTFGDQELDLSRYQIGLLERYKQFRLNRFVDWLLFLVDQEKAATRSDLVTAGKQALDFSGNPQLRSLQLDQPANPQDFLETGIAALFDRGWVEGERGLAVTTEGKARLRRLLREPRRRHEPFHLWREESHWPPLDTEP
jgi:Co/Zn/Cd efflux system component